MESNIIIKNNNVEETIYDLIKSKKNHNIDEKKLPIYDSSNFPIINVKFSTTLDRPGFDFFIKKWLEYYSYKTDFTFIFDLQNLTWVNPSYSLLVVKFMKLLRKHISELSYLKTSIMIINNNFLRGLMFRVFQLQPPISHIYLVSNKEHAKKIAEGDILAKKFSVNIPPNTLLNQTNK